MEKKVEIINQMEYFKFVPNRILVIIVDKVLDKISKYIL